MSDSLWPFPVMAVIRRAIPRDAINLPAIITIGDMTLSDNMPVNALIELVS